MDATPTESTNAASDALSPVVATSSKEAAAALSDVGDHAARLGSKLEALSQDSTVPFVCHLCGVTRNFVATQTTCGFCFHPIDAQRAPSSSVASVAAEPAAASPTLSEVLATMDAKFNAMDSKHQTAIAKLHTKLADVRTKLAGVRTELADVKSLLVTADMTLFLIQLTDIMQSILCIEFSRVRRARNQPPIIISPHQSVLAHERFVCLLNIEAQALFNLLKLLSQPRNIVAHPSDLAAVAGDEWNLVLGAGNVPVTPIPLNALFVHLRGAVQSPIFATLFTKCGLLESAQLLSVRGLDAVQAYSARAAYQPIVTDDLLPASLALLAEMRRAPHP
jgi:hypothetical protein